MLYDSFETGSKLTLVVALCTGGVAFAFDHTKGTEGGDRTRSAAELQQTIDQCTISLADAIRTADRESGGKCFSAKLVDWQSVQDKIDPNKIKNRDLHEGHPVAKVCDVANGKIVKSFVCCKTNQVLDRREVSGHEFGYEPQGSTIDRTISATTPPNPTGMGSGQNTQSAAPSPAGRPETNAGKYIHRDVAKNPTEIQRRMDASSITAPEAIVIAERATNGKCAFVEITDWQCVQSSVDSSKTKNHSISSDQPIARIVCVKDGRKLESIVCGKTKQVIDTHECGMKTAKAPAQSELAQPVVTP